MNRSTRSRRANFRATKLSSFDGDQEQLAAVEGGGGMMLLARRLGFVQLSEQVRFAAAWERAASLRLRAGDASVLDEY
jgi:hypothetical protein